MPAHSPNPHTLSRALVVDGNPTSRAVLVTQLREFGVSAVTPCSRLQDARRKLEYNTYDIVVCEQTFDREETTGQDLLDDLRRNQLLPFHTVFVMVTADASYAKVAEAAEAALDAYLVKPHTAARLAERIEQARQRKSQLQDIFTAIEQEDLDSATEQCERRFASGQSYGLYAARMGAEMMMRSGRIAQAQKMYEAVVATEPLPWARLGVARAQLEGGYPQRALNTLEALLDDEPDLADAHDVMGRTQFELGHFQSALLAYKKACALTPTSVGRLLKHGMMACYAGDREEGIRQLERATRLGLDSKTYDSQALVLLAFARLAAEDRKGLSHCCDDLTRLLVKNPESRRQQRQADTAQVLSLIQQNERHHALEEVQRMAEDVLAPDFDFDAGCNLLALLAQLEIHAIYFAETQATVDTLARRFCTSRALTELLAQVVAERPELVQRIRDAHADILKRSEDAMSLSLNGNPQAAVERLMREGEATCNAKLIEAAHRVLHRYADRIPEHETLRLATDRLRNRFRTTDVHAGLGDLLKNGKTAGGVGMPGGYKAPHRLGLLAQYEALALAQAAPS